MIWDAVTSANRDQWSPENPSRGQCAVTALLIQDLFGGDLMRTTVQGESHYFNRFPDGSWHDLTLQQFVPDTYDDTPEVRDRAYVLSFPETRSRYIDLKRHALRAVSGSGVSGGDTDG